MKRLSHLIFIFSVTFALLIVSPAFLNKQFGPFPLMKTGDVTDILTPVILIPLYWLLFQLDQSISISTRENITFLVFAALWASGQGMHLSANSVGHLAKSIAGSDIYALTYFYDEVLSHYIWHIGLIGLACLLILRQWQHPFTEKQAGMKLVVMAGIIHGANFFATTIEAGTAPLGILFATSVTLFGAIFGRERFRRQPILTFFFVTCVLALILFACWAIYWKGLPQFSEVGIIN